MLGLIAFEMFLSEVCKQKGLCILLVECNPHKDQSNNLCMVMTDIYFIILNVNIMILRYLDYHTLFSAILSFNCNFLSVVSTLSIT